MIKKTVLGLLLAAGCFYVLKTTSLLSYAGTLWCQVKKETTSRVVSTRLEIDRARHEIAGLDGDINHMLRPIAEHMAAIKRLKKDMHHARSQLAEQKNQILTMARDLEGNPTVLHYGGEDYSADRVRKKLQRDFESYKRAEAHLQSQEKLLDARQRSLAAVKEQLTKVIAKKREYEIRLGQLEADEETLRIARIGSKLPLDDNRASDIEQSLAEIEHRQEVQRSELELLNGSFANDFIPVGQRPTSGAVPKLDEIRDYFQKGDRGSGLSSVQGSSQGDKMTR